MHIVPFGYIPVHTIGGLVRYASPAIHRLSTVVLTSRAEHLDLTPPADDEMPCIEQCAWSTHSNPITI